MLRKFNQFLQNHSHFSKLIEKVAMLEKKALIFSHVLGEDFAAHCRLAKIEKAEAIIIVDSSVWANKLRYRLDDILKELQVQSEFKDVKSIRYKISTKLDNKKLLSSTRKLTKVSKRNITLIKNVAKKVSNQKLQKSLERLSQSVAQYWQ